MSLRRQLAAYGFESNDDYEFALRCLFEAEHDHLRVLHVDGTAGRRKTAFANALGHALDYPHILYHDFTGAAANAAPEAIAVVSAEEEATGPAERAVPPFDRVVTEACAYSEGARTMLILDQLQAADFSDQLRLYHFAATREWQSPAGTVLANARNLLVLLISEHPVYHSLAKISFRVWTDVGRAFLDYRPQDFGLGADAQPLFAALGALFEAVGASPTPREFGRILADALQRVRSEDQLRQSLLGWIEGVERERLFAPDVQPALSAAMRAIERQLGVDHIEL